MSLKSKNTWANHVANNKPKGLGDTIAKITTSLGIKPCGGCKKRQEKLNKLVPYGNNNSDK
jgi:hypothetical protein